MKKTILFLIVGSATVIACNSSGSSSGKSDSAATAPAAVPAASEQGLELIGASDCTTCHRLHKTDRVQISDLITAKLPPNILLLQIQLSTDWFIKLFPAETEYGAPFQ